MRGDLTASKQMALGLDTFYYDALPRGGPKQTRHENAKIGETRAARPFLPPSRHPFHVAGMNRCSSSASTNQTPNSPVHASPASATASKSTSTMPASKRDTD